MNYMWWLGLLMFAVAGALLHDVPFLRFAPAFMLIVLGTVFGLLSKIS